MIYLCREGAAASWQTGPEYQVLDDAAHSDAGAEHRSAALYDLEPAIGAEPAPAGAWNDGRIVVTADRIEHWLNGVRVVDCPRTGAGWSERLAASKFAAMEGFGVQPSGRIALQDHGDAVRFHSLRIRRLP